MAPDPAHLAEPARATRRRASDHCPAWATRDSARAQVQAGDQAVPRRVRRRPSPYTVNILSDKAGQHDACFALVKDGEAVFGYEHERIDRAADRIEFRTTFDSSATRHG